MTFKGRSLDDLPLAAYSTGVAPSDREDDPVEDHVARAAADAAAPPTFAPPALGVEPAAPGAAVAVAHPAAGPAARLPLVLPPWLANPRANLRDPRLLMTGVIGVGVVLLAGSLIFGGGPAAGVNPNASASAGPPAPTVAPPTGDATLELTGKIAGTYQLAGSTGTGPATAGRISTTWTDPAGDTLTLAGAASSGTRTTDPTFTLTWSVLVEGTPVTFTSDAGECTVGMAVQPRSVTGSFVCKKLTSDDGAVTVDARGSYRT